MLQRKQTLFMLLALTLEALCFFFPFASFIGKESTELVILTFKGIEGTLLAYPIIVLQSIICLALFLTIFLYRKRFLQIRFLSFTIVLFIGQIGFILYYFLTLSSFITSIENATPYITMLFPLIALIFTYIAIKYVAKDEALMHSLDRLR